MSDEFTSPDDLPDAMAAAEMQQQLDSAIESLNRALAELQAMHDFQPRAYELLTSRNKVFVPVTEDEPFFLNVYGSLREFQKTAGTWTPEDEHCYQLTVRRVHIAQARASADIMARASDSGQ